MKLALVPVGPVDVEPGAGGRRTAAPQQVVEGRILGIRRRVVVNDVEQDAETGAPERAGERREPALPAQARVDAARVGHVVAVGAARAGREGGLRVRWRLGDGSALELLAQLAPTPAAREAGPVPGTLLFATHPDAAAPSGPRRLPAWSVAWTLDAGR